MITLLLFILILGILVLAHEWGHFIVARRNGLTVEEFGFGFPPRIFSWKSGGTLYSINLLPLGGFVKILGENGDESEANNPKSFSSKSIGVRSLVTIAGVIMNFLLGALLLIIGFYVGLPQVLNEENEIIAKNIQIQIVAISNNSPAEKAGLKLGDALNDFGEVSELQTFINKNKGKEIALAVNRGKEAISVKLTPRTNPPVSEGAIGVALVKTGVVSYSWRQSIWLGAKSAFIAVWEIIKGFFGLIKNLLMAGEVPKEEYGPGGVVVFTKQTAKLGV